MLKKIAFLLTQDLERFIEKEAMMVNQSILANRLVGLHSYVFLIQFQNLFIFRRAFTKLYINLTENDIQREMGQRLTWQEKVQDWKVLNAEAAVEQFRYKWLL